jgi:DNA invertase Pin-like site-specific DNA recombinase
MRAAVYCRISKDVNDGQSVEDQEQDCRELAARRGLDVVSVHTDNDISGYKGKRRTGFEALMAEINSGAIDAVIAPHIDRITRNRKEGARFLDAIIAKEVPGYFRSSPDVDPTTATGRMIADFMLTLARGESERISERVTTANRHRAERGQFTTTHRTFGYTRDGMPQEPEATAIRQAVVDVLAGTSLESIAKRWNDNGLQTTLAGAVREEYEDKNGKRVRGGTVTGKWNGRRVRRVLMNPKYAGVKIHRGKHYAGKWTPLVDKDTHEGLVRLLSDPARVCGTSFERKFLGSTIFRCDVCGGPLSISGKGAGRGKVYRCREAGHVSRTALPLDEFITAVVVDRMQQPDAAELVAGQGVDIAALSVQREALQRKLDGLTQLFDTDQINVVQFGTSSRSTRDKLQTLDRELADATRTSPAAALAAAVDVWDCWQAMTVDQRSQAVDELLSVRVLPLASGARAAQRIKQGLPTFDPQSIAVEWRQVASAAA